MGIWVVLLFIAIVVAILAFSALFEGRRAQQRVAYERLAELQQPQTASEESGLLRDELLSDIPQLNRILTHWSKGSRVRRLLLQADMKMKPGKFLLACGLLAAFSGMLVRLWSDTLLLPLVAAAAGAAVPVAYALVRRSRRFQRFEALFPEAIDLIGRATRAGHPFTAALELVGNEMAEPIGGEFRQVFEEQKFGMPIRDALLNLADRIPIIDVRFFVTALMLQRETGGNLAEILDNLSYVIRERFKVLRQVRTYSAQGRLTMIVLLSIPPGMAVMMSIVNPQFMKPMFTDPLGHTLIAIGITLQFVGFLMIRRIVNIKV